MFSSILVMSVILTYLLLSELISFVCNVMMNISELTLCYTVEFIWYVLPRE